jgi:hypothetical protein
MLIASPKPVTCVIWAYYKNSAPSLLQKEKLQHIKRIQRLELLPGQQDSEDEFQQELCQLLENYSNLTDVDEFINSKALTDDQITRTIRLKQQISKHEGIQRGYLKDPLNRDSLSIMATTACYTGYQFSTQKDIIKLEMELGVRDVDVYVAPTFINLENPTFWMNQGYNGSKMPCFGGQAGSNPGFKFSQDPNTFTDFFNDAPENFSGESENLLRKIIFANNMSINLDFLDADFVDNLNAGITMDVAIERLEGSMNGSEWWRFYHVIEQIVLSRGEKAAEVIQIENRRAKEMKRMKTDFIRDIINSKLKNQYKEQQNEIKPDIAKRVTYSINDAKLKLFNNNRQFSALDVKGIHGKYLIYSNREAKQDLDIEKITVENLLDGENYRWVLCPVESLANPSQSGRSRGPPRTMVQMRFKDKFIVVSEAPWKVYDQIEIDIFPTSICLTRNLHSQFKKFIFESYYNDNEKETVKDKNKKKGELKDQQAQQFDRKYHLLVPAKNQPKSRAQMHAAQSLIPLVPNDELGSNDSKRSNQNSGDNSNGSKLRQAPARGGLDNQFSKALDTAAKRADQSKNQNAFQSIGNQREPRDSNHQIKHYYASEQRRNPENLKTGKQLSTVKAHPQFPVFFKYFRMNEIQMNITYFHEKNSFLNSKDLWIKLAPFISHYKFLPHKKMYDNYQGHCKKVFISQIPNILKQKFLKAKQKVDEVTNVGVTNSLM